MKAVCAVCGRAAICVGAYEGETETQFACDACCGHGNEDGWCQPLEYSDGQDEAEECAPCFPASALRCPCGGTPIDIDPNYVLGASGRLGDSVSWTCDSGHHNISGFGSWHGPGVTMQMTWDSKESGLPFFRVDGSREVEELGEAGA